MSKNELYIIRNAGRSAKNRKQKLRFPFRCASLDEEERIAQEKAEQEQARLAEDRRVCDHDVSSEWCVGNKYEGGQGLCRTPCLMVPPFVDFRCF